MFGQENRPSGAFGGDSSAVKVDRPETPAGAVARLRTEYETELQGLRFQIDQRDAHIADLSSQIEQVFKCVADKGENFSPVTSQVSQGRVG